MPTLIIDRATNMFGSLNDDCMARLRAVLDDPTAETWDDAYSLMVNGSTMKTLWQAWIAVDPSAPRAGVVATGGELQQQTAAQRWPRVPDKFTLYRALLHAINE
jgi:hypothetical protein